MRDFIRSNYIPLFISLFLLLANIIVVIINRSFIFNEDFLQTYGDQQLYYQTAHNIINFVNSKSYYTLGYPLIMLPLILIKGNSEDWRSIMTLLIGIQAFLVVPLTFFLILKGKLKKEVFELVALIIVYFFFIIYSSPESLLTLNFFGLVPLSEPFSVFFLIISYHIFLNHILKSKVSIKLLLLISFCIAFTLLIRNTLAILFAPIFLYLLIKKEHKKFLIIAGGVLIFYMVQIAFNIVTAGDPFFSGYVWWAETKVDIYKGLSQSFYGIENYGKLFSLKYVLFNITKINSYVFFLYFFVKLNIKDNLIKLIIIFTIINILFYSTYLWTGAEGLIDRFLLPNYMLIFYLMYNKFFKRKNEVNKRQ